MAMNERASRPLDRESFPMRLWEKSLALGTWTPASLDFATDAEQFNALDAGTQQAIARVCALFTAGERAVTTDLLPFIRVVAAEGRLEEELYLATFLCDEAKHVDVFDRFAGQVLGGARRRDWSGYEHHRCILEDELPMALGRLDADRSAEAQVRAAATYNLVVEGVLAETGYYVLERLLAHADALPAMRRVIELLKRDESRHIAYGVYLICGLIVDHGDSAYGALLQRLSELRPVIVGATGELVRGLSDAPNFALSENELLAFTARRSASRLELMRRARSQSRRDLLNFNVPQA
jgi:ribonucleoside-diphosphate reductase beta chain